MPADPSRNGRERRRKLPTRVGAQMEQVFQGMIERTRARLNVKRLKTTFGAKAQALSSTCQFT
jgi:hypothetical protein